MEQSLTLAPALSDTPAIAVDSEIGQLSLWRLIGRRFFRNRLAVGGGALILCLYVMVIFAEFFTPYDHLISDENFVTHPPQLPRFIDAEGNFHLRPFVYGTTTSLDTHNLDWLHEDDTEQIYPFKLFVKGVPYKLLGLIPAERHLYGVEAPGTAFLLGTDRLGRDMFSAHRLRRAHLSDGRAGRRFCDYCAGIHHGHDLRLFRWHRGHHHPALH